MRSFKRNTSKLSATPPRLLPGRRGPSFCGGRAPSLVILITVLCGCRCVPGFAQNTSELWGRPVTKLQLQCDCDLKLQNFPGAVTQQIGEPLDSEKISDSLKRLYATGRFSELRAEGVPEGAGVAVTFVSKAQYFVGIVSAEGKLGPVDARGLVTAARLHLGQPLESGDLDVALKNINNLMSSNGYYQPRITDEIDRNPGTLVANVRFIITAGAPARVSAVEFQDDPGYPAERLKKVSGWRPHMFLTATRLERGLYRLRQFYSSQGYLQANLSVPQRVYDAHANSEKVTLKVAKGSWIQVKLEGASISKSKLQEVLPLFHDGVTDEPALEHSARLLGDYFEREGYFSASVKADSESLQKPQPHVQVHFRVELGRRGQFAGYGVEGNQAVPTADLMAIINPPAEGLLPPSPTYSRTLVEQKVSALLALYQSRGYQDARVTPALDDNYEGTSGRRRVTLTIQEGELTTVCTLTLAGLDADGKNKLWPSLVSKPLQPYALEKVRADRDRILDYLADHGYSHATASWRATPVKDAHQVDLEFTVVPGAQDRIKRIVVVGNEHTRLGLVNRELRIHAGEPASQSAVFDSQRRLYDLGIFSQVQVTPLDQGASNTDKTMLVGLEESRRWSLGYGGGVDLQRLGSNQPQGEFTASPRLSLDITRLNVGGRGQTFGIGGRISNLQTGADTSYLIPRLLNRDDLSLRLNGLLDRSRDVLTFTALRKIASVTVEKRYGVATVLTGQYSFRLVQALDISDKISPEEIPLLSQPTRVGLIGGSYVTDRRDDPLDATRGSYSLINAGVAWQKLGSQANFLRFTGQNSTYYLLNSHLIFARNTEFGVISPYGAPYPVTVPPSNGQPAEVIYTLSIPLPERYYMGGSESMRGFSINQAGPRDLQTGYPLGGNALFLNTFELRTSFAQRSLGLVLFEDTGNVFSSIRYMRLLKFSQSSPQDFNYDSAAVGIGLRYKTPLGPIRFDVGYNLNPPYYNVVTTTNGITNTEEKQLPHFQFFISIGQSF